MSVLCGQTNHSYNRFGVESITQYKQVFHIGTFPTAFTIPWQIPFHVIAIAIHPLSPTFLQLKNNLFILCYIYFQFNTIFMYDIVLSCVQQSLIIII